MSIATHLTTHTHLHANAGGPNNYHGKDMAAAHKNLMPHLEEVHFNAIVENFVATLQELGVGQDDIDAAVAIVATTKADVLA